jgi:bifunctional UDP-N-acetylglucosamine pyrophosphorylase/glucosamine-1-phosphate N-acetyltransferase
MMAPQVFDALAAQCYGLKRRPGGGERSIPCDLAPRGRWSEEDLARLRAFAATLPADVVALQEIDGADVARTIFPQHEFCFTKRRQVQNVGFAIRRGLGFRCNRDLQALGLPEDTVRWGADVTIEPGTALRGNTSIGADSVVGPHTTATDARIGTGSRVVRSHLVECEVGDECSVGPFAYLRPGARLETGAKVGTFVEVKNSVIGAGAKVPHLAYIGDAEVGAGANVGAGSITANYDGRTKHRTKIGESARIGVNNSLVAPVGVGDGAYTGAGALIREDVPDGALGVSDVDQRNIEGWAERRKEQSREEHRE